MEVIEEVILHSRPDKFRIYPIGDIHAGSFHCAEGEVKKQVAIIKEDKKAYWLGMGDYADAILKDDKRFDIGGLASWVEKSNIIESQRVWLKELFEPIKDKCLGLLTGNHEECLHNKYQNDLTRNLCKDLGVRYGGYQAYVNIVFNRRKEDTEGGTRRAYLIHAWHGAGSAQTEGARLMRLVRLVNDIQADIYLMGHLHAMTQHTPDRLILRSGRIRSIKLAATITGSWLRGYTQSSPERPVNPTYIERQGYKPSRIGCPSIVICPGQDTFYLES